MPASVSVERGEKLAIEPELLPPISFPRQQMIEAGVRDMRTLKDANIQSERESIAAALERELPGVNRHPASKRNQRYHRDPYGCG